MSTYAELLQEHATLQPFSPYLPTATLQPLAIVFLSLAFVSSFYFSTLRSKGLPLEELAVGGLASVFGGFGLVFAFCSIGVNV